MRRRGILVLVFHVLGLATVFAVAACGDDGPSAGDSSLDSAADAVVDSGELVSPVATAARPDFSACPAGWRSVPHPRVEGVDVCDPWPATGREACAGHEMHLPGAPGCVRIGSECPSDGWPSSLPASDVVYVRADAPVGGDGSRGAPYQTLVQAAAVVVDGGTIAVAIGVYEGRVDVPGTTTIIGACAEGVVLHRASGTGGLPIISVTRAGSVDLRDVTMRSTQNDRLLAMFADVSVQDVVFDGVGIVQFGGDATIDGARFSGVSRDSLALMSITGADTIRATRVSIEESDVGGASLLGEVVVLADAVVSGAGNIGVQLNGASSVLVARVVVEDVTDIGLTIDGPTTGSDLLVRGVRAGAGRTAGVLSTGDATLTRVRIEGAGDAAMSLLESTAVVKDLVVHGGAREGGYERGIEIGEAATASIERVVVSAMNDFAFLVSDEGTTLTMSDVLVDDVATGPAGGFGRCLHAQLGARVETARTRFVRCREAAVTASFGASVVMRDALIDEILPLSCATADCPDAQAGIGLVALEGDGSIDVERFTISEAALTAIQVIPGGEIDVRDGTIRDNPVGINVQVDGYDLGRVMDRVIFEDNGLNLDSSELPIPGATVSPAMP